MTATDILALAAYIFMGFGVLTFGLSIIGILRMPDSYTRIHAGTKASTMGTILILLGTMFLKPLWIPKLILLGFFILATSPISSSILVKGSYIGKSPMFTKKPSKDYRKELRDKGEPS
ncbi:MAG: monovalent cation/H(+) antiporter subunit G [Spirochaetales bacterium]|nr:monovalent cation/H(+) antiporter subunit G [Spirochaetales bacterium]